MMDEMEAFLNDLDQLLCREIEVYQQFLALETASAQVLTGPALEPILSHLQAQDLLSRQARELERQRQQILAQLASLLRLPLSAVTLQHLSACAAEPYASRFFRYRSTLQRLVCDLQQCQRANAAFLQDSLTLVNHALSFFRDIFPKHTTYGQSGTCLSQPQGRVLSERI